MNQETEQKKEDLEFTEVAMAKLNEFFKSWGGIINPWLWLGILAIILIGQSFTVKAFIIGMLCLSAYFRWFHGENNIIRKYANRNAPVDGYQPDGSRPTTRPTAE